MEDPELWNAIHRVAGVLEQLEPHELDRLRTEGFFDDVDGIRTLHTDGLLDSLKGKVKDALGMGEFKKKATPDDYKIGKWEKDNDVGTEERSFSELKQEIQECKNKMKLLEENKDPMQKDANKLSLNFYKTLVPHLEKLVELKSKMSDIEQECVYYILLIRNAKRTLSEHSGNIQERPTVSTSGP